MLRAFGVQETQRGLAGLEQRVTAGYPRAARATAIVSVHQRCDPLRPASEGDENDDGHDHKADPLAELHDLPIGSCPVALESITASADSFSRRRMTPEAYEHHVSAILRAEGWRAEVTPYVRDFGLDVIAERGTSRLGVQAKMYAAARRVNGRTVMELHGAADLAGCSESMIATNGALLDDAKWIADKLGVQVRHVSATAHAAEARTKWTFGRIWNEHACALVGRTLSRPDGTCNEIVRVDEGGLVRRTSGGALQHIEIEIFRWVIERLLRGDTVLRDEINAQYAGRASSGIVLVLASLPMFESVKVGGKRGLRLHGEARPDLP